VRPEDFAALREAVRQTASHGSGLAVARRLAGELGAVAPSVAAVVFFGSQRSGAQANEHSAYDLFVAVDGYRGFYRELSRAGLVRRQPLSLAALNALLPPNILSLELADPEAPGGRRLVKAAAITLARLERETSAARRDHFCAGRLFQPAEVVYARDAALRERVEQALTSALVATYAWSRPWLPAELEAETYGRTLLAVSLAGEIRPESAGRAAQLWNAERVELLPRLELLLEALVAAGELRRSEGGAFTLVSRPGGLERLRLRRYFAVSKARATLRWLKYMWTFEDWLGYLVRKVERHTGRAIVLTPRERSWPLLFLWPRFFRHLRDKDRASE
jgi:hypothetical protein